MQQVTTQHDAPTGYLELIQRNRNFRFLWFGQIVSLLGDWFNLIASASLVSQLTDSGIAIGSLFVVRMLAPFLVSPVSGVAADRYNRKWLLILADLSRAVTLVGFLFVRRPEHVWLLYALTALQLGISGFFFPTRNAILPDIVSRTELGAANALSAATWSVMLALGAALGGIVAGGWGIYPAFIIDAFTFLASAVLIGQVAYQFEREGEIDSTVAGAFKEYFDGLRYLRQQLDHLVIALHKPAFALLVSGAFQVVMVVLAEQLFVIGQGGSTGLGLLYAAVGVGTGVGPIVARRFTGDDGRRLRIAIVTGYAIAAAGLALTATLGGFMLVLLGTFLRGIGNGIGWVLSTQLLLQLLPDRVRGRVFSTEYALMTLSNAAGAYTGGWLLDSGALAVSDLLWGMALFILVPGALWAGWLLYRPEAEPALPAREKSL